MVQQQLQQWWSQQQLQQYGPTSTQQYGPTTTQQYGPTSTPTSTPITSPTTTPTTTISDNLNTNNNFEYYYIIINGRNYCNYIVCDRFVYYKMKKNSYDRPPTTRWDIVFLINLQYKFEMIQVLKMKLIQKMKHHYIKMCVVKTYEKNESTESNTLNNVDDDYSDVDHGEDNLDGFPTSSTEMTFNWWKNIRIILLLFYIDDYYYNQNGLK